VTSTTACATPEGGTDSAARRMPWRRRTRRSLRWPVEFGAFHDPFASFQVCPDENGAVDGRAARRAAGAGGFPRTRRGSMSSAEETLPQLEA